MVKRTKPAVQERVLISYERTGFQVHLRTRGGVTNHELREVLVGLWSGLERADRIDHINELQHYEVWLQHPESQPGRHLSPLATAIREALRGEPSRDRIQTVSSIDEPEPEAEG